MGALINRGALTEEEISDQQAAVDIVLPIQRYLTLEFKVIKYPNLKSNNEFINFAISATSEYTDNKGYLAKGRELRVDLTGDAIPSCIAHHRSSRDLRQPSVFFFSLCSSLPSIRQLTCGRLTVPT